MRLRSGPFDCTGYCTWILESYLQALRRDPGAGTTGHLLTFGRAVVDLHELGYDELARRAEHGHREMVRRTLEPPEVSPYTPYPTPEWVHATPELAAHWQGMPADALERTFAHAPKYAYAMLGLCARVPDRALVAAVRAQYAQVFCGRPRR